MGRKRIDLTGRTYNKLTVIKLDEEKSNNRVKYWLCKCECGNTKSIEGSKLKNGTTKACGCMRGGIQKYEINEKKLYKKWLHMKARCYDKNDISYKNYGNRGIKVCEEWLDYNNFAKWSIENGYNSNLELDRINTNGNYEPSNCRYVTHLKNSRNKRSTLKYNYKNEILTLKEIADLNNIDYKILWQRIKRNKKTLEEALEVK